ncbi:sigma E factor positive regulatory protein RseC [Shewanella ulleungensis]|jgi:sigma-E factor negative regulatory protein RseC|uniref:Sigma E factor positive regulatory protein RseC n=2 Tax=Shewanella ulleungensis TaxID=2282699 RepID=A0ABQ2QL87_9GAMM|nr:sigma E factor positive regulatory protein RseC [Shewanella ulleungensis]
MSQSTASQSTMMEEIARVVDYQQGWATVEVELKSACNHCASSENCGTSTIAKAFSVKTQRFSLPADKPCREGDLLKVGLPESVIIKAAALVYLLPLLGLFVFATFGHLFAAGLDLSTNAFAMIFGAIGAVIAWFIGKHLASKIEMDASPVIIAYLGQEVGVIRAHQA